jgi:hypothetical protein
MLAKKKQHLHLSLDVKIEYVMKMGTKMIDVLEQVRIMETFFLHNREAWHMVGSTTGKFLTS